MAQNEEKKDNLEKKKNSEDAGNKSSDKTPPLERDFGFSLKKEVKVSAFKKLFWLLLVVGIVPLLVFGVFVFISYGKISTEMEGVQNVAATGLLEDIILQSAVLAGVLVVFVVLVSLISARVFSGPVKRLLKGIKRFASGELDHKIEVSTNDEVGVIASAFNKITTRFQRAYEREKTLSEMKSGFISVAAHQLRTPLSAIKWTFKMLLSGDLGKLTPEQKSFVRRGNSTNERMIALINDLLGVSRIEEGRFGYEFDELSIKDVIEEIIEQEKFGAKENNVDLIFKEPEKDATLYLDKAKIRMAIVNLIDNAIKYTLPGGKIEVKVQVREKDVKISVSDTGIGIPEDQQDQLFTRFFRGENAVRMQTSGSGLGLYIVKNIVEQHDGKIWVNSEEGKGTTFSFTIPRIEHANPRTEEDKKFEVVRKT